MAYNTYSDLKTSIANWLARSDLTSYLDDFISLGEERLATEMRIRGIETALSVTMASGVAAVPSDFVELKHAYIDGNPIQTLEVKDSQWLYRKFPSRSASGKPKYIAIDGAEFVFGQYPDSSYDVKGTYYFTPAVLSGTNATNEWTDNVPGALLFASLCATAPFLKEDNRIQVWENEYEKLKTRYNRQQKRQARRGAITSYS